MGDGQLLFINKTQSSHLLTRSAGGEKAKILSHVQAKRRKAQADEKKLARKAMPVEEAWTKHTSSTLNTASIVPIIRGNNRVVPRFEPTAKQYSFPGVPSNGAICTVLPTAYPTHNGSDPFYCTAAQADAGTHALLKCTFSYASRANFLAEAFAPQSVCMQRSHMRHDDMFDARLRQCVEDETLMYATLAYGSSLLGWMMNQFEDHRRPEYFLGKALRSVRLRLHDPDHRVDDWLLLSVYALAVTEMWNGLPTMWTSYPERHAMVAQTSHFAFASCRTHLRMMLAMVAQSGGWHAFDPYVLDSAILADKYLAVVSMQQPVIPLTWDPGPLSDGICKRLGVRGEMFPHLGRRFHAVAMSSELRATTYDLIDYCRIAHEIWMRPSLDADVEAWLFRRLQALSHRLILHLLDQSQGCSHVEKCVCMTLLIFIFNCTPSRGPQVSAVTVAEKLALLLEAQDAAGFLEEPVRGELLLWCVCTAAMVSEPCENRGWLLNRLAEVHDGELSEDVLQKRLELFMFWPERRSTQLAELLENMKQQAAATR